MKFILIILGLCSYLSFSVAEQTTTEKAKVELNTVERQTKKTINRTKEALCGKLTGDSKTKCLAKKAKHRIEEGTEAIKDKAIEVKEKIDTH